MTAPRMLLILSENWTLTDGRNLGELVRWARIAEDTGFDSVMISEHVVLGRDASDKGVMGNPRDYAMPGNQDPLMPWPNSLMIFSAIASVTTRVRLVGAAVIAPLRHPLLLARELGTLLAILVYFRRADDPRWGTTFVAPGLGFIGLCFVVILAFTHFEVVAGSEAKAVTLLPLLLVVALAGGIGFAAYLRSARPAVYDGLTTDLERFDETAPDSVTASR